MYRVQYKTIAEIQKSYNVLGTLSERNVTHECVLIDYPEPLAKFIETDIPCLSINNQPLKDLVRCYIINVDNTTSPAGLTEILNRYG